MGRLEATEKIDMTWIDAFTYEGSVVIPYPGEWAVVPFPYDSGTAEALWPTTFFEARFDGNDLEVPAAEELPASDTTGHSRRIHCHRRPLAGRLTRPMLMTSRSRARLFPIRAFPEHNSVGQESLLRPSSWV